MSDLPFDTAAMEERIASASNPRREIRRGLLIAGCFFGVLLGGAALIPLHAGTVAQGIVSVSGSRQLVQHREGGILSARPRGCAAAMRIPAQNGCRQGLAQRAAV